MPKLKTTYAYKIQSTVKEFRDNFMESINNQLYCNLCNCAVSCNKRFLVDSHRNTSKHQKALGSISENLIPQTSQLFLRSSDTDFVEKLTKAFLSADIPLYKLNIILRILKTSFVTLVTDCLLKLLVNEQHCNLATMNYSEYEMLFTTNNIIVLLMRPLYLARNT